MVDQSVKLGTPMIGIAINYRLGGLGFISSRQVAGTKNLNLGIKDQRLALHWVQENIGAFGGDPKKVTLFGQSAGALSVGIHQLAYGGRDDGLFRGTIMQSSATVYFKPMPFPDTYQTSYDFVIDTLGCTDALESLQCLRAVDIGLLNAAFNTSSGAFANPVIDGDLIKGLASQELKAGRYVKVPSIIGATDDEGASYARGVVPVNTEQELRNYLVANTLYKPHTIDRLLQIYDSSASIPPAENFTHPDQGTTLYGAQYHRLAAIITDLWFSASKRYTAQTFASHDVPVWTYRSRVTQNGFPDWLRAGHFTEIAFVFYNFIAPSYDISPASVVSVPNPLGGPNAAELKKLADFMSKSWVRFIASGDPSAGITSRTEVKWPKYNGGQRQIVFDVAPNSTYIEKDDYRKEGIQLMINHMLQNAV
ncbi:Acetylcholinesterase [Dactylellina cionopaga]|nr:Acetylcholinesterase [Dactylellina cionopaga]